MENLTKDDIYSSGQEFPEKIYSGDIKNDTKTVLKEIIENISTSIRICEDEISVVRSEYQQVSIIFN